MHCGKFYTGFSGTTLRGTTSQKSSTAFRFYRDLTVTTQELLLETMTIQQTRVLECLPQVRGCDEINLWSTTRTAATPKTRLAPSGQADGCSGRVTLTPIATHQPP